MQGLAILGATGTIGLNTLDVAARHPDRFRVVALSANRDDARMLELCRQYTPDVAVMADAESAGRLKHNLGNLQTRVLTGADGLKEAACLPTVDTVMAGIVGAAGLLPSLAAVKAGKRVLLANKEPLVMAGRLFMQAAAKHHATLLPVDSEHNAIFQCLPSGYRCGTVPPGVRRIILTASGGPFRDMPLGDLPKVTPEQAVRHPNWVMGPKISIDSATMMNKGLELIEASWLFSLGPEQIDVMLHPQSVVHSLVDFDDGSQLAQLGQPDMRVPIAHALAWPDRVVSGAKPLDLSTVGRLDFGHLDQHRFPCMALARAALKSGGNAPVILNAANEVAVQAFLDRRLGFTQITDLIEYCLNESAGGVSGLDDDLEQIMDIDRRTRHLAQARLDDMQRKVIHV